MESGEYVSRMHISLRTQIGRRFHQPSCLHNHGHQDQAISRISLSSQYWVLKSHTFSNTPSAVCVLDLMYPNSPGTSLPPNITSPGDSGDSPFKLLLGTWVRAGDVEALFALDLLSY